MSTALARYASLCDGDVASCGEAELMRASSQFDRLHSRPAFG